MQHNLKYFGDKMGHIYFFNGYEDCKEYFDFVGRINFLPGAVKNKPFIRQWIEDFCEGAVFIDTRSGYGQNDDGELSSTTSYYFENENDLLKFKVAFGGQS